MIIYCIISKDWRFVNIRFGDALIKSSVFQRQVWLMEDER